MRALQEQLDAQAERNKTPGRARAALLPLSLPLMHPALFHHALASLLLPHSDTPCAQAPSFLISCRVDSLTEGELQARHRPPPPARVPSKQGAPADTCQHAKSS